MRDTINVLTVLSGLILIAPGVSYIITSPVCGFVLGKEKVKPSLWVNITGMIILVTGYIFFAPIPQLKQLASVPLTVAALCVQGVGFSISYIGNNHIKHFYYALIPTSISIL